MNKTALVYHSIHKLLFKVTFGKALERITATMFAAEQFLGLKLLPRLGFHPSEKYFAYSWIFRHLLPSSRCILDVGCGDSLFPCELARRGYKTYAIDITSSPWTYSVPFRHPKVHFVQADICHSPFQPHTFDVITAISTLEHIPEDRVAAVTREMNRILTNSGLALVTMPIIKNTINVERVLSQEFNISKQEYYIARLRTGHWDKSSEEEALGSNPPKDVAVVHLALTKKPKNKLP